jgi:hypothetical protein
VDPTVVKILLHVGGHRADGGLQNSKLQFGIIAWDDINNTAPVDYPTPSANVNLDWMITGARSFSQGGFDSEGKDGSGWIESNAMRRMGNTKGLLFVIEYNGLFQNALWSLAFRYLLKE